MNFDMDQLPRAQNVCNTLVAIFAYGDESSFPVKSGSVVVAQAAKISKGVG